MKKFTILLALLALSWGCSQTERSILTYEVDTQNITPLARETCFPADSIGNPVHILFRNEHLIVSSSDLSHALSICNMSNGYFQRTGRMGRGANEIQNTRRTGAYPSENGSAFFVFDSFVDRMYVYSMDADSIRLMKTEPMDGYDEFLFQDNIMIGVCDTASIYILKDYRTGTTKHFQNADYSDKLDLNSGRTMNNLVINETQNRLARFSYLGESYEIIDYSDPDNIKYPFHKTYLGVVYPESVPQIATSSKTKMGFIGTAASDKYIFALCGDKTINDHIKSHTSQDMANNICVFDWNGMYVKRLICDKPIRCMDIDKGNNILYAMILDDDLYYKIVSFALDEILK